LRWRHDTAFDFAPIAWIKISSKAKLPKTEAFFSANIFYQFSEHNMMNLCGNEVTTKIHHVSRWVLVLLKASGLAVIFPHLFHIQLAQDAEFFDALPQRRARDAEHFRGVNLIVAGFFERLDHQFAFDGGNDF
jgi:hypothetical protein